MPRAPARAVVALVIVLGGASAATSGAEASDVAGLYQAYWAGLPAGEISLVLHDAPAAYRDQIAIRSEGLPRVATRFRGSATSTGQLTPGGLPVPTAYEAVYDLRKRRDKRLSLRFVARAGSVIADRGAVDTSEKPPLAQPFRTNVLDPLSALTAIRAELRRGNRGTFRVPVYDGARRFDVLVRVLPKTAGDPALHLELTLAPIAGFKGETSDDGDPDTAPRPATLAISDDAMLLPLALRVSLYYLPLVVQLTRRCDDAAACGW